MENLLRNKFVLVGDHAKARQHQPMKKIVVILNLLFFAFISKADFGTYWTIEYNNVQMSSFHQSPIFFTILEPIEESDTLILNYLTDVVDNNIACEVEFRTEKDSVLYHYNSKLAVSNDPIKIPIGILKNKLFTHEDISIYVKTMLTNGYKGIGAFRIDNIKNPKSNHVISERYLVIVLFVFTLLLLIYIVFYKVNKQHR